MSTLFPEPSVSFTRPLANLEPHVVWLQRSTRPDAVAARARVNAWYREFSDPQGKLAAKLVSTDNKVLHGALDELYVHHALRKVEPDVRYEEGGQGPDLRVYRAGHQILAVEVLSLFLRADWASEERRHGELTDRLNKRFRPQGYFLDVEVLQQEQGRNLPLKELTEAAGSFLQDLQPPPVTTGASSSGERLHETHFIRDGIHVRFEARPMKPNAASLTNPNARIVGTGALIGGLVDSDERLKDRLNAKRKKRYSLDPTVPFILVVGNHDLFCDDLELLLAVYGRDWEAMVGKRPPLWHQQPQFSGFFGIGQGERPYHTRFAAVAVVGGSMPWYDPTGTQWLVFDNPHGRVRLPDGLLPANHRFQALSGSGWGWTPARPLP
jgi:hypothetical protein